LLSGYRKCKLQTAVCKFNVKTDVASVSHDVGVDNGPSYCIVIVEGSQTGMRNSAVDIPNPKVGRCQIDLPGEGE